MSAIRRISGNAGCSTGDAVARLGEAARAAPMTTGAAVMITVTALTANAVLETVFLVLAIAPGSASGKFMYVARAYCLPLIYSGTALPSIHQTADVARTIADGGWEKTLSARLFRSNALASGNSAARKPREAELRHFLDELRRETDGLRML